MLLTPSFWTVSYFSGQLMILQFSFWGVTTVQDYLKINVSPESELLTLWLTTPIVSNEPWATWQRASGTIQCCTGPRDLPHPPPHSQIAHASENSSCHGNHCFALLLPAMHSFSQCVEKQIGLWQSAGGLFGNESWGDWSGWKTHEGKKTHSNQTNKKSGKEWTTRGSRLWELVISAVWKRWYLISLRQMLSALPADGQTRDEWRSREKTNTWKRHPMRVQNSFQRYWYRHSRTV